MFDKQKLRQLEQRSHTRGLLSKEFYHNQQLALEKKRKAMKEQLDRQVQERRRQKQAQKLAQERKIKQEEEDIKNYYRNLENREKKYSSNQSMKQSHAPYQTYPNVQDSRAQQQQGRNRGASKPSLLVDGDIPLLPVMPPDSTAPVTFHNSPPNGVLSNSKSKANFISSGAIPLLDLSQDQSHPQHGAKTKKTKKTKRQKTLESQQIQQQPQYIQQPQHYQKVNMSRHNQPIVHQRQKSIHHQERRSTLADEESIMGSVVRNGNSLQKRQIEDGSLKEIEEVENQNNSLRMQLKKNQEAISLLMGAVRSNGKLEKFRVQAEKILTGNMQSSIASKKEEQKREEGLMLPRINMRNQSIMHDYLLSAARRAKKSVGK